MAGIPRERSMDGQGADVPGLRGGARGRLEPGPPRGVPPVRGAVPTVGVRAGRGNRSVVPPLLMTACGAQTGGGQYGHTTPRPFVANS